MSDPNEPIRSQPAPHVHGPDCQHDHASAEPIRRVEPKRGRNDPCPCGSGRKYKKCHGGQHPASTMTSGCDFRP
jgi:hypothetical protein